MSKNLTRKGLVFGTLVALTSTAIAGTPAFAANELNLQPSSGTTYGSILGETFTLSANTNPGFASSEASKLKFNITNAGKAALTIATNAGADNAGVVNAGAADNSNYVATTQSPSTTAANTIKIKTAATATASVGVQAWIDSDFDSVIDAGEWSSAIQTVTFNKASEVTWSTALTAPALGSTNISASVTAAPSINLSQLASSVQIGFATLATGTYTTFDTDTTVALAVTAQTAGAFTAGNVVTYDAASDSVKYSSTTSTTIAAGNYVAQALFDPAGATAIGEVGNESVKTVSATTIAHVDDLAVAAGANTKGTGANIKVRAETKSYTVTTQLYTAWTSATDNTKAATAKTANITVTAATLDTTSTITVGGKTITSTTTLPVSFDVTSDATGKVSFDVVSSTGKANDSLTFTVKSENVSGTGATVAWLATAANDIVDVKGLGTSGVRTIAKLGSYSIDYAVNDNFGQLLSDGYRLAIAYNSAIGTAATKYVSLSGGKGTLSVTDASTTTGNYSVVATLEKLNATTSNWDAVTVTANAPEATSTIYVVSSVPAVATVSLDSAVTTAATTTATTGQALTTTALAAVDTRVATSATAHGLTGGFVLSGTISDVLGTAVSGQTVTISGAGLGFTVGTEVLSLNSVAIQSANAGTWAGVTAYSNTAGKKTITITSGSASKTVDVYFAVAASDAGSVVTISAPATSGSGKTLTFSGVLTDKFGNPVKVTNTVTGASATSTPAALSTDRAFSVVYDGPGLVVGGSLPTATDADGKFSFKVLLGADDTGLAKATVSYDADANFTTTTAAISKSASVLVGVSAGARGDVKAVSSLVKNAAGLTVKIVRGAKVATAVATSDSYRISLKGIKAGQRSVKVYVNDVLVKSKTVTVK